MVRVLFLCITCSSLVSCASYFLRKDCEKTNWFQHGNDVAMNGERLDSDDYIKKCERVEAKINYQDLDLGFKQGMGTYCKPKTVFNTGKTGKPFKEDMCDVPELKRLRMRYQAGLKIFCQPENAKIFGAKGGKYLNVCPSDLEPNFFVGYRKGRKVYLSGVISDKQKEMRSLDTRIDRIRRDRDRISYQLASFRPTKKLVMKQVQDASTGQMVNKMVMEEDERSVRMRQRMQRNMSSKDREVDSLQSRQEKLRSEVEQLNQELRALQTES